MNPPSSAKYWAHSSKRTSASDREGWQLLADHLRQVSAIARNLALAASPHDTRFADLAEISGSLHDLGKYSDCFQRLITTGKGKCTHSIQGAILAYKDFTGKFRGTALLPASFAIAGHHAGLADFKGGSSSLKTRLENAQHETETQTLTNKAISDWPGYKTILEKIAALSGALPDFKPEHFDLYTRMLFSCLVDADRLDTAGRSVLQEPLRAQEKLDRLLAKVDELRKAASPGSVTDLRQTVLDDCLNAAAREQRIYSLSVPTGGGKTLSGMAFALKRAALRPDLYRRIIVVIPYLSIIEQNAEIYVDLFGRDTVLEHHSGSFEKLARLNDLQFIPQSQDDSESSYQQAGVRPETENWDAPVIVTTSVRFFESLFSNRTGDLRRVHNIARSIVILDEVQTLPRRLLAPLLSMIRELSEYWGCTFVFSTATLPAFERPEGNRDPRWARGSISEIVRDPDTLRKALRRTEVSWQIDARRSWEHVADTLVEERQALCVVNLRDHALDLYKALKSRLERDGHPLGGLFHLSTRMCAAHRLRVLATIRERLRAGETCWIVSTQLIEAGVDLDVPLVMRALAPLDSVVQAAGRADREGKLTHRLGRPGGRVIVFRPEDDGIPPNEYKEATGKTAALAGSALERGEHIQVDSSVALSAYYERYYGEDGPGVLGVELQQMRDAGTWKFASLANEFEMINTRTQDVFVPDDDEARAAIADLRRIGVLTVNLRRRLQRHTVGLYPGESEKTLKVAAWRGADLWVITEEAYSEKFGVLTQIDPTIFVQ